MTHLVDPTVALPAIDRFLATQENSLKAMDHDLCMLVRATVVCDEGVLIEVARFYALGHIKEGTTLMECPEFIAMATALLVIHN